jgi:hypothetical protein
MAPLFDSNNLMAISSQYTSAVPKTMEELGQNHGFLLYRTHLRDESLSNTWVYFQDLHDRFVVDRKKIVLQIM